MVVGRARVGLISHRLRPRLEEPLGARRGVEVSHLVRVRVRVRVRARARARARARVRVRVRVTRAPCSGRTASAWHPYPR